MTAHELGLQKEREKKNTEAESADKAAQRKREVTEDSYTRIVEIENVNRLVWLISLAFHGTWNGRFPF